MSLKKFLKRLFIGNKGQVFMEYMILLATLAVLTIVATSGFFQGFRGRISGFQTKAVSGMGSANTLSNEPEPEEPTGSTTPVVINFGGGW